MNEVGEILGFKDDRATKKWLDDNGVPFSKLGQVIVVDEFLFDLKREQIRAEKLQKSYPSNWFQIYAAKTEDKAMIEAIRILYPETRIVKKRKNINIPNFIK